MIKLIMFCIIIIIFLVVTYDNHNHYCYDNRDLILLDRKQEAVGVRVTVRIPRDY